MTTTRYMSDLLDSTNEHVAGYLAALETAAARGKSRAAVINFHFGLLALDFEMRFSQTIGTARALSVIALASPKSTARKQATALLRRVFDDFDYFCDRTGDRDLRRHKRGNDHNTVCRDIVKRFEATIRTCGGLSVALAALSEHSPLAGAGTVIVAQIVTDYEMLVEQFRDFQHDGRTTVSDDGDDDEEPMKAAA